ncbi:MAG: RluA family pseudouridine synthase [Bifidobacteriaceae bacterium]|jgi:23S rRNA pseudouridine1911/1915/1917 synthase|nr:RluA family pseudouridine synthase [Bifidobacteriaceae bacterium]
MKEVAIPESLNSKRADLGLSALLEMSRAKVQDMIKNEKIKLVSKAGIENRDIEKETVSKSYILQTGDIFSVDNTQQDKPKLFADIPILYNDKDIVVVNKPAGVATHEAKSFQGADVFNSLVESGVLPSIKDSKIVQDKVYNSKIYNDKEYSDLEDIQPPGIVSRLDVGTSGVLLICKSQLAYDNMLEAFKSHINVVKNYVAVVQGHLKEKFATIDSPIGRSAKRKFRFAIVESGKRAITHYKVRESYSVGDLVDIELATGRTHQIRVHFSEMGHPVLGDTFYGASSQTASDYKLARPFLHSAKLQIIHPVLNKEMEFSAPLPDDLQMAYKLLSAKEF